MSAATPPPPENTLPESTSLESTSPENSAPGVPRQRRVSSRFVRFLGSYGLACLLLLVLFCLTAMGTLYQTNHGLHDAKQRFFNSWFLWREFGGVSVPIFPAGVTAMSLLALNLVVGGIARLRMGKRTLGVLVIHLGIAFMLIASLVKLVNSEEGHLTLYEGERSDQFVSYHDWEVAIWDAETAPGEPVTEHVIDHRYLEDLVDGASRTFEIPGVPFELVLSNFLVNSEPLPKGPNWEADSPVVEGFALRELPRRKETERHIGGLHARAIVDGEEQEALLWGFERLPWTLRAGGTTWAIKMRHTRFPMPYEIRLEDFQKEDHPGTRMAKAYRSYVQMDDGAGEVRILIEMNEPLREGGLVLFQSGWGPQNAGPDTPLFSTFSVVRNPSDKWPEYALWIITLGLLYDFGRKLIRFVRRMARRENPAASGAA